MTEFKKVVLEQLLATYIREHGPIPTVALVDTSGSKYSVQHCELYVCEGELVSRYTGHTCVETQSLSAAFHILDEVVEATGRAIFHGYKPAAYGDLVYLAGKVGILQ